ncbi:MAG: class I SAM-dependent methyltransferase [Methanolobus sp.]|nr:class I SAM-dependent methyltransferase [Methanolobus sp.]
MQLLREKGKDAGASLNLYKGSMDLLPLTNRVFDIAVTSVTFCETSSEVRKSAIKEVSRVLKDNAYFAIVDCAKPLLGLDTAHIPQV